ncbi:unnamed protein product [Musa acuminata subsp. malaccensis]|uniref:(wild Malaysian banana) hypothetical protein n=1 Tax=Musa acuminata subsp. malaccensis TaxID=214687 RepID=A0A804KXU2_MUSAM|nr:unnamed protein product [Musa acuminata subsp. malaccensis]
MYENSGLKIHDQRIRYVSQDYVILFRKNSSVGLHFIIFCIHSIFIELQVVSTILYEML